MDLADGLEAAEAEGEMLRTHTAFTAAESGRKACEGRSAATTSHVTHLEAELAHASTALKEMAVTVDNANAARRVADAALPVPPVLLP